MKGRTTEERRKWLQLILGVGLAAAVAHGALPAAAATESIEEYRANAIEAAGRGSSVVEIRIYRWSTDEEREELLQVVKDATAAGRRNDRTLAKALRGQPKTGYMFLAGKQGHPLRYSRLFEGEGKRRILLATDRPVSFREAYQQSQLGDFDITVIELIVDDSGNGEGVLSVGTEVKWNEAAGKLEVTNVSSQPIKLTGVRKVN